MRKVLKCISPVGAGCRSVDPQSEHKEPRSVHKSQLMCGRVGVEREVCWRLSANRRPASMVCSLCLATAVKISCNDRWGDIYDVRFILLFPSPACFLFVRSNSGGTNVFIRPKEQRNASLSQKTTINFIHLFSFLCLCSFLFPLLQ